MIGSAFLVSNAKNDRLRLNNIESVILCVFMTDSIMLFSFYTAMLNIYQNFFGYLYEKSFIQYYKSFFCFIISKVYELYLFVSINKMICFFIRPPPDMLDFSYKLFAKIQRIFIKCFFLKQAEIYLIICSPYEG